MRVVTGLFLFVFVAVATAASDNGRLTEPERAFFWINLNEQRRASWKVSRA